MFHVMCYHGDKKNSLSSSSPLVGLRFLYFNWRLQLAHTGPIKRPVVWQWCLLLTRDIVVEIIVAISTDRSVSIEPLFHIGERRHIFLDAQLFANSLLFGVYVSIKFGNDIGSTIQIRFKYFIIDATHAHATESRSLMYGNATIVRGLKRFEIYV